MVNAQILPATCTVTRIDQQRLPGYASQGSIEVASQAGRGSAFTVRLPPAEDDEEGAP